MQTEVGYIQEKDYLPKPEPFYHKPNSILIDGIYKLDWEEDAELKAKYDLEQKLKVMQAIYDNQDAFLKAQFSAAKAEFERLCEAGNYIEAKAILTSPYIPENLKSIADTLLTEFEGIN